MKKIFFALMLLMTTYAYAQNEDHLEFDAGGRLIKFDVIGKDGDRFIFDYPMLTAIGNIVDEQGKPTGHTSYYRGRIFGEEYLVNYLHLKHTQDWQSFYQMVKNGELDEILPARLFPVSRDDCPKDSLYTMMYRFEGLIAKLIIDGKEGMAFLSSGGIYDVKIDNIAYGKKYLNSTWLDKNDYIMFNTKGGTDRNYAKIGDYSPQKLVRIRKTCVGGAVNLSINFSDMVGSSILFDDGGRYEGSLIDKDWYSREAGFNMGIIDTVTSVSYFKFDSGKYYDKDGNLTVYSDGQADFFATEQQKQAIAKQKEEERKQKEAGKKALANLVNKYGKKNVDDALNGKCFRVGMPEELFLKGLSFYKYDIKAQLEYKTEKSKCYRLYYYNDLYGWVWFTNGKVSSIDYTMPH